MCFVNVSTISGFSRDVYLDVKTVSGQLLA